MTDHPELQEEQKYFDHAYEAREHRRSWLQGLDAFDAVAYPKLGHDYNDEIERQLSSMGDADEAVAFGRIAKEEGDTYYIGRGAIVDDDGELLVINWQAPAAAAFYQATPTDPLGVTLKRSFVTSANTIEDIIDQYLAEALEEMPSVQRDLLLKTLEEHRDGRLRDIVETIERAQDAVMRADVDQILVIQGGPGTGKTIIGLQRIAVVRYQHRDISAEKVLFVGPTRAFIDYVEKVLPGIGNQGVAQRSINQISRLSIRRGTAPEDEAVRRVKGDVRMADLMRRLVASRHRAPEESVQVQVNERRISLDREDLAQIIRDVESMERPHNPGREQVRDSLTKAVADVAASTRSLGPRQDLTTNRDLMNLLDRMWPTVTARQLLRDLFASERQLEELGSGLLEKAEWQLLFRPQQQRLGDEPWTDADLALADELDELIRGGEGRSQYEVVVVDEAQDLSAMQLRMVARRCDTGRLTVLGDLAQATSPAALSSWLKIVGHLAPSRSPNVVDLKYGYRVPSEIMEVARRAAESDSHGHLVPEPVRSSFRAPEFRRVSSRVVYRKAIETARAYLQMGSSVGLIVAPSQFEEMKLVLDLEGVLFTDGTESLTAGLVLVPAEGAKGLEFDSVVVVEPALIVGSSTRGASLLYVALTRATRSLSVVYSEPLPTFLSEFESPPVGDESESEEASSRTEVPADEPTPESPRRSDESSRPAGVSDVEDVRREIINAVADHLEAIIRSELTEAQWPDLIEELKRRLGL